MYCKNNTPFDSLCKLIVSFLTGNHIFFVIAFIEKVREIKKLFSTNGQAPISV
jgi:hypothetical protein